MYHVTGISTEVRVDNTSALGDQTAQMAAALCHKLLPKALLRKCYYYLRLFLDIVILVYDQQVTIDRSKAGTATR